MCSDIALCQSPLDGDISDTPSARFLSVYIVISELDMLIWWHELSILLIHHCISALADNLIYPQISFVLFFHELMRVSYVWWNNKAKEENCLNEGLTLTFLFE